MVEVGVVNVAGSVEGVRIVGSVQNSAGSRGSCLGGRHLVGRQGPAVGSGLVVRTRERRIPRRQN